jgi:hypothetical protein
MTKTISFKGKIVYLDSDPRIGVCTRCRYVVGQIHKVTGKVYKNTHLHHEQYDENNAVAHTIELCSPCHRKADFEEYNKTKRPERFWTVRIEDDTHQLLHEAGKHGESFDQILKRLLDEYEKRHH